MTRPLRITYPGAVYHIINRGCRKDKIFRRLKDREEFLARLQAAAEKYKAVVHAYCLMDNHYHLLVETPQGDISSLMQLFQTSYANWFRAKYNLIGPLFQSRYKSVLVEDESYLVTLSAYIHLNPVRAKMVESAEVYQWSSCPMYLTGTKTDLVNPERVLEHAGGKENYCHILEQMINDVPEAEAIYGRFSILGKEAFKEKVLRQRDVEAKRQKKPIDKTAQPEYRHLSSVSIYKIAAAVMKALDVPVERLTAKTLNNTARKLYLYLLKKHTPMKIVEIAKLAGMNYKAAGELIRAFERKMKASKKLTTILNNTEKRLNNGE